MSTSITESLIKWFLEEDQYKRLNDRREINKKKAKDDKKINEFLKRFKTIMFENAIYDKFDRTVTPYDIKVLNRGGADCIVCKLAFPDGLSTDDIGRAKSSLSQNVYGKCMVFIEDKVNEPVMFSAIKEWHNVPYNIFNTSSASELFVGYDVTLNPVVINLASYPHMMITGGSGGGKSKLVEIIISNLASCNTKDELNFYFLQVAKDDNFKFELLEHCMGCVTSSSGEDEFEVFENALKMLEYINSEMKRREKLVKNRLGRMSEDINIHIYNKKFKDKMPVIQLWIDEAASLYKKTSCKELNAMIERIKYIIQRIASTGRYIGIYLINVMQRASKEEISREIKINTLNWISFNQVDASASQVAIGDQRSAVGLPQRVFAYKAGTIHVGFCKTPFTRWDENVSRLKSQGKIRIESEDVFDKAYAHWKSGGRVTEEQEDHKTKMVDIALNKAEEDITDLNEKLSALEFEIKSKDIMIKKLTEENNSLINKDINVNTNNESDTTPSYSNPNTDKLLEYSKLEYSNAAQQKQIASELSDTARYTPISQNATLSLFSGRSKRVVAVEEEEE